MDERQGNVPTMDELSACLVVRGIARQTAYGHSFHNDRFPDPKGRVHPRQSPVQHEGLGWRAPSGGQTLEIRRASGAERQLRLGAARHPPSRADWRRELCARQRLDVVQAARRRAAQLREQQAQARKLDEAIWKNLKELGYGG